MKKLIAILTIAIVLVGAIFATDAVAPTGTQRITVKTTVDRILPVIEFKGANTTFNGATPAGAVTAKVDGTDYGTANSPEVYTAGTAGTAHDGAELESNTHIDLGNVVAYFKIAQANGDGGAKCNFVYTLSVSATTLKSITDGVTYEVQNTPVASADGTQPTAGTNLAIGEPTVSGASFSVTATYTGVVADQDIAYFKYTWAKDNAAPNATYAADVTLTYTAQ